MLDGTKGARTVDGIGRYGKRVRHDMGKEKKQPAVVKKVRDDAAAKLSRRTLNMLVMIARNRGTTVAQQLDMIAGDVIAAEFRAVLEQMQKDVDQ